MVRCTCTLASFLGCVALACGGDDPSGSATDTGGGSNVGVTMPASASDSGIESVGDDKPRLDFGNSGATDPSDSGGDGPVNYGCTKVDLLFVIDNSGSMADEQQRLIANFPTFVNEIQTTLADVTDYHVGVVTSDDYWNPLTSLGINSDEPECRVLGGLVTATAGGGTCAPYAGGGRYITQKDDLASAFACAANVGDDGIGIEKMAASAVKAVTPALHEPGACNEGFIRKDALLVLVLITDEDDDVESGGTPDEWYASIVAAKYNIPDNIVVLSLVWDDTGGNPNGCVMASDEQRGATLMQFTYKFVNGSVGSVCVDSYQPFFHDAISVIDTACDEFEPPS